MEVPTMKTANRADRALLDALRSEGAEIAARMAHLQLHGYPVQDRLYWEYEAYLDGTVAHLEGVAHLTDVIAEHVANARQTAARTHSEHTCAVCRGIELLVDPRWSGFFENDFEDDFELGDYFEPFEL